MVCFSGLGNLVDFSMGKGMLFGNFVKVMSNFGDSCEETQVFYCDAKNATKFGKLYLENANT